MFIKNKKGFTLIEIIVVVVILAVLMAVAVPAVLSYVDTAQEAPALTECNAIVTAAQKRVINKFSESHADDITLNSDDNAWIEEFVGEGGEIQNNITVANNEVTRVLYKASNGLYVLYNKNKNPEYSILSQEDITNSIINELGEMTDGYSDSIKELLANKEIKEFESRETVIAKLFEKGAAVKVNPTLQDKTDAKTDLYWKPYYLGSTKSPSIALFANPSQTDNGQWKTNLVFVNGQAYTCKTGTGMSEFYKYSSAENLQKYLDSSSTYTRVDLD